MEKYKYRALLDIIEVYQSAYDSAINYTNKNEYIKYLTTLKLHSGLCYYIESTSNYPQYRKILNDLSRLLGIGRSFNYYWFPVAMDYYQTMPWMVPIEIGMLCLLPRLNLLNQLKEKYEAE